MSIFITNDIYLNMIIKNRKKVDKHLYIIIFIFLVTFILLKLFTIKSSPLLMEYAENKSKNIINTLVNNSLNKIINKSEIKIIDVEKNNQGDIVNINFNNNVMNEILYKVTDNLLNDIYILEKKTKKNINDKHVPKEDYIYFIPIGIINNIPILTNIGPKIPFKIEIISSTENNIVNNVKEYGINSSLVEIVLNIKIQIEVILPFQSKTIFVNKNIILESKIIQGKIPQYYGGFITSLK